jgi:hypothetical protein
MLRAVGKSVMSVGGFSMWRKGKPADLAAMRSAASEQRALLAGGCCTIPASLPYLWTPQGSACRRFCLAIAAGLLASTIRPHTSSGCLRLRPRDRHFLGSRSGMAMFPRITPEICKALMLLARNRR